MSYVPLNLKTGNYLLSSMIKIPELVKLAKEKGLDTLSIADNNMYGVIDFYKACKNNGIKPIVGLEVLVSELKVVLYCQNYSGYKNLIKLSTLSSERQITLDDLMEYGSDVVCIMPYVSKALYNDLKKIYKYFHLSLFIYNAPFRLI